MIDIHGVKYGIPGGNPRHLPHKRRNPLEWLASLIMSSHVCQICRRKEIWSVTGWLQIDDPVYHDKEGCSVICNECWKRNQNVFGKCW